MRTISSLPVLVTLLPPMNVQSTGWLRERFPPPTERCALGSITQAWNGVVGERLSWRKRLPAGAIRPKILAMLAGTTTLERAAVRDRSRQHEPVSAPLASGYLLARGTVWLRLPPLNQAAPFHVVEEKCLWIACLGVEATGPPTLKPKSWKRNSATLAGARVEVIAGIERVVAPEIPGSSMELLGARLDDHADRARRRQAVFGAVVRSQSAELGDGVHRGQHVGPAATPTVRRLAAVDAARDCGSRAAPLKLTLKSPPAEVGT